MIQHLNVSSSYTPTRLDYFQLWQLVEEASCNNVTMSYIWRFNLKVEVIFHPNVYQKYLKVANKKLVFASLLKFRANKMIFWNPMD